jgi:hypothetical protein
MFQLKYINLFKRATYEIDYHVVLIQFKADCKCYVIAM